LLVGSLPGLYSISLHAPGALVLDHRQLVEVFLTAAQSAFAVALLANLDISRREAVALLGLFVAQLVFSDPAIRQVLGVLYLLFGAGLLLSDRERIRSLLAIVPQPFRLLVGAHPGDRSGD